MQPKNLALNESNTPSRQMQEHFWDDWNKANRGGDLDRLMERQRDMAVKWVQTCRQPVPILEVGCGMGWLANQLAPYGPVTAVDLSAQAIATAAARFPHIRFAAGDFQAMTFEGRFGFITSADVIAHVPSHQAFIDRVAELLEPRGVFVLMTQNAFVWNRSSELRPQGEGQLRNWPHLRAMRKMLAPKFRLLEVTSIFPGGDRGVLRLAHSRWVAGVLRRLIGRPALFSLYERLLIGRELVVVAQRR
jgi:2-polyprenyl-3-methyl-5-hydroxy-6-metoxy-1,4-benzoquinol methylase